MRANAQARVAAEPGVDSDSRQALRLQAFQVQQGRQDVGVESQLSQTPLRLVQEREDRGGATTAGSWPMPDRSSGGTAAATTAWACCRSLKRPSGVKNSKADRVSFQALSAAIA